jgi:hypothetical protein
MSEYPMTDVIASREYVLEERGKSSAVLVQIGKPAIQPDEPPIWYCPFSISGPKTTEVYPGLGADSVQALTTALSALRIMLEAMSRTGKLTLQGDAGVFIELE